MIHAISKGGLGLIVICDGDRIEGIVTDGDVRRAMERLRGEFFNIKAADIATRNPKTIAPDEKLIEAEKMMTRNKVTSLLVTDDTGKLSGRDSDLRHQTVTSLCSSSDSPTRSRLPRWSGQSGRASRFHRKKSLKCLNSPIPLRESSILMPYLHKSGMERAGRTVLQPPQQIQKRA